MFAYLQNNERIERIHRDYKSYRNRLSCNRQCLAIVPKSADGAEQMRWISSSALASPYRRKRTTSKIFLKIMEINLVS